MVLLKAQLLLLLQKQLSFIVDVVGGGGGGGALLRMNLGRYEIAHVLPANIRRRRRNS